MMIWNDILIYTFCACAGVAIYWPVYLITRDLSKKIDALSMGLQILSRGLEHTKKLEDMRMEKETDLILSKLTETNTLINELKNKEPTTGKIKL